MKSINKVVVVCYCLITMAFICVVAVIASGVISVDRTLYFWGQNLEEYVIVRVAVVAIAVILFIAGAIAMSGHKKSSNHYETQKIKECTFGTVSITVLALEEIAKRYFDEVKEVRTIQLSTLKTKTGIEITVRTTLAPQVVIPEITEKVQTELKQCLESFTGIIIEKVNVIVCDSTTASR